MEAQHCRDLAMSKSGRGKGPGASKLGRSGGCLEAGTMALPLAHVLLLALGECVV